uniref:P-loop containing nucleoside triphosphate hydrolase protein n=1 Tax=Mycena chlorophos TaxID=658473 RepID=A0ABQ0LRH0_MYCCL|nr:predicted protein [Mycena chlorophos]
MAEVYNPNPTVFAPVKSSKAAPLWLVDADDDADDFNDAPEPIDPEEIFDLIRSIADPEHPNTLEELRVVSLPQITIHPNRIHVEFTPTVPHCGMSTLIGLSIRVRLLRALPSRFKIDITLKPGSHQSELAGTCPTSNLTQQSKPSTVNKQLNDKERVAAALENPALVQTVEHTLENAHRRGQPADDLSVLYPDYLSPAQPARAHWFFPTTMESPIVARLYQEEIFKRAQQENIIAALDTGSGKTFISLLLIKWISIRPNAKTIFLVPKAALVEQQARFITPHSTLRVEKLSGFVDIPMDDADTWNEKLDAHDVISLLVFDEAHNCQKNHPYAVIMREYFQLPSEFRPKIFGMTASPVWNVKNISQSMSTLETSLDAKIVSVRQNTKELQSHARKPVETVKLYLPQMDVDEPTGMSLETCLDVFASTLARLGLDWDSVLRRHNHTRRSLGAHCASLCMHLQVSYHFHNMDIDEQALEELDNELLAIRSILGAYRPTSEALPLELCSSKLRALCEVLLEHFSTNSTMQGIVFVEQRQTAACLARVLPLIFELRGILRCGGLFGQKEGGTAFSWLAGESSTEETILAFRERRINLIIATSIAEEGLDFQACNLVVRFDPINHMIGYVQSRGRARMVDSAFVVLVEEGNAAELARYEALSSMEGELKARYQQDCCGDDLKKPQQKVLDTNVSERFVVKSTGAVLTHDNATNILNRLCSHISRDGCCKPKYSGVFEVVLVLPSALGLPPDAVSYTGPLKESKREAKRAVAFLAVKRLFELGLLDEQLLPKQDAADSDVARCLEPSVRVLGPDMMRAWVKDPWTTTCTDELWIHPVNVAGRCVAGLITGTRLPSVELGDVCISTGRLLGLDTPRARDLMHRYTKECISTRISGTPLEHTLTFYLVPIQESLQPDWAAMERFLAPFDRHNLQATWVGVDESHYGRLLVKNINMTGRYYTLRAIRNDLSPSSAPSTETEFSTYSAFWASTWTSEADKRIDLPYIPQDGALIELDPLPRLSKLNQTPDTAPILVPMKCCRVMDISEGVLELLPVLPGLYQRITSVYRARRLRECLSLPPIADELLVEALTLPSATGLSNQRLETLGDAVLQLCTTVHIFNRYPRYDEGQLSRRRQAVVSNRFLREQAKELGLEAFIVSETPVVKLWIADIQRADAGRCVEREFPKRSWQETMESVLGASYVTGGIEMALLTGQALGMHMGGTIPWSLRYSAPLGVSRVPGMFLDLQDRLGYSFNSGTLLVEALTHPSFQNDTSYERLEFLGDAVASLVVMDYMYRTFPSATPDELAWPRTRAVAAPAQAMVGIKKLRLHRLVLLNDVALSQQIEECVPELESCTGEEIINCGWRHDPPKVLSDVFESVIGAVLVDSGHDWDKTAAVVEGCMDEILPVLGPSVPRDPITEVFEWTAKAGCLQHLEYRSSEGGVSLWLHGLLVCGPLTAQTSTVAKQLVSVEGLAILKSRLHEFCSCRKHVRFSPATHLDVA